MAAVFITVIGKDLQGIWLYVGSVILISVFKWVAGHLIERIYHERWWDYSKRRWNMEGYISITDSALLGVLAVVGMKWGNTLFVKVFHILPEIFRKILVWALVITLMVDILTTLIVLRGEEQKNQHSIKIDRWFQRLTSSLGLKIFSHIEKRIKRAYPDAKKVENIETSKSVFACGCSFYKVVWLFLIGAFLGDITETIFCRITMGSWMSRSSVVWGPFSIVWGFAIAFVTILLHKYQDKPDRNLFFAGTFLGGRINLLYCFFWGIAAVVWIKGIYPKISRLIEKIPMKIGKYLSWGMILFMCCNMVVSSMALIRSTQRKEEIPAEQGWQKIMDERFDDERLEKIYPNAINTY